MDRSVALLSGLQHEPDGVAWLRECRTVYIAGHEEHVALDVRGLDEAVVLIGAKGFHDAFHVGQIDARRSITGWGSDRRVLARPPMGDRAHNDHVVAHDANVVVFALIISPDPVLNPAANLNGVAQANVTFHARRYRAETMELNFVDMPGAAGGRHIDPHHQSFGISGPERSITYTANQQHDVHENKHACFCAVVHSKIRSSRELRSAWFPLNDVLNLAVARPIFPTVPSLDVNHANNLT